MTRSYRAPGVLTREEAELLLRSNDPDQVCEALVAITFHDPDPEWAREQCSRLASHPDWQVRAAVATCLGELVNLRGSQTYQM